MKPATFNKLVQIVYDQSGICLGPHKKALVQARVGKRLRALQLLNYESYIEYLMGGDSSREIVYLLNTISTNVTHFFREPQHFEKMESLIEQWIQLGQKKFKFWSAACSSGEEPYSMNAVCQYLSGSHSFQHKILATDISTHVLNKAGEGVYKLEKLNSIPKKYFSKMFSCRLKPTDETARIKEELKSKIYFNRINLCDTPFPMKGSFDIIFCRNVMIYFDNPTRKKILNELIRLLRPGGYLFVGHAESLTGQLVKLKPVCPSVYINE